MLRLRNLTLVLVPAVAIGLSSLLIAPLAGGPIGDGAIALALVPAPLAASEVVTRLRGRMDLAGALVLGTIVLSLLATGSRGALAAGALFAAVEAFAIVAMVANALPTLRDAVLAPLRFGGWAAAAAVVVLALVNAPSIGDSTAGAAAALVGAAAALFVAGTLTAAIVALLLRRDVIAAVAGAGLRDPVLAVAFAAATTGPESSAVPLVYGVFCLGLAAVALRRR